jgi:outer membrane protein TolC
MSSSIYGTTLAGSPNTIGYRTRRAALLTRADQMRTYRQLGFDCSQVLGRNLQLLVQFNLNVPLRNTAARADMIKNQLDYRQAEIDVKQAENSVRLNVVNARISLAQARASYETAVKARKLQEQTFTGAQRKYELGTASFTDVVLLQRDVVTSQTAETNALNGYIKARNNMDLVLGRLPETNHVGCRRHQGRCSARGRLPVLDQAAKR